MKIITAIWFALAASACSVPAAMNSQDGVDAAPGSSAPDAAPSSGDVLLDVFNAVDKTNLVARLDELTGATPVTAGAATFSITNRWAITAKANFRAYWLQYYTNLGAQVSTLTFPIDQTLIGESLGHNVEAVFPGESKDSVVIITHYDSVGITGKETQNGAADDAGSGLAMQMEAARIFATYAKRRNTIRIVAADYEEISNNLDGDYAYASYLKAKADAEGWKILVVSDDDQTGWSCWDENACHGSNLPPANSTFKMISCSGDSLAYNYPELSQGITDIAHKYSTAVTPQVLCDGAGDTDHYPFWTLGIPAYVIEEYDAAYNPHYDATGNDTIAHMNLDLLTNLAKVQIAYQAKLIGIDDVTGAVY